MAQQTCPECGCKFDPEKHTSEPGDLSGKLAAIRDSVERHEESIRELKDKTCRTENNPPAPTPADPANDPTPIDQPARLVFGSR